MNSVLTAGEIVSNGPMPRTKIAAFFEEFPWLKEFTGPDEVEYVYVRRVDSSLLTQLPMETVTGNRNNREYDARAKVKVLDARGNELVRMGQIEHSTPEKIIPAVPAHPNTGLTRFVWPTIPAQPEKKCPARHFWTEMVSYERFQDMLDRLAHMEDRRDRGFFILSILNLAPNLHGIRIRPINIVVIYKTPKDHDMIGWLRTEQEREHRQLLEQIAKIDEVDVTA